MERDLPWRFWVISCLNGAKRGLFPVAVDFRKALQLLLSLRRVFIATGQRREGKNISNFQTRYWLHFNYSSQLLTSERFFLSISTVGCSNSQMVAGFQTKISKSSVVTLVDRKPKTGANQSDSQTRKRTKLKAILYPLSNSEYLDVVAVARLCSFGLFTWSLGDSSAADNARRMMRACFSR
jgi:hypothetical protein